MVTEAPAKPARKTKAREVADSLGVTADTLKAWVAEEVARILAADPTAGTERQYTPAEVADLFGCDERTVRRWIERREITAIQLPGRHWRIAASEVERIRRERFSMATS